MIVFYYLLSESDEQHSPDSCGSRKCTVLFSLRMEWYFVLLITIPPVPLCNVYCITASVYSLSVHFRSCLARLICYKASRSRCFNLDINTDVVNGSITECMYELELMELCD